MKDYNWIYDLKPSVLHFMDSMKSRKSRGYYRYSYNGDLYDDSVHWNVGSSVFALKIYHILGVEFNNDIQDAVGYILSFKKNNGMIYDDLILKKSLFINLLTSVYKKNFGNILNKQYKIAESKQAYSALDLFNSLPEKIFHRIPMSNESINKHLSSFNWNRPWNAGSHFGHLMFFFNLLYKENYLSRAEYESLTEYSINWVNNLQDSESGSWFKGNTSPREKINGAMKIITGLISVGKENLDYSEKLIDLCLDNINNQHACDNFNIILVLYYVSKVVAHSYRMEEIQDFAISRLGIYRTYYKPEQGGFSFLRNSSNKIYYGAKIARGFNEADIHGTYLFLFGISLTSDILNIKDRLGYREFRP